MKLRVVSRLAADDVSRLKSFRPPQEVELNRFALVQTTITVFLDGGEMHEYILPGRPLNEAISLGSIEPFHCTLLSHNSTPFDSAQVSDLPRGGGYPLAIRRPLTVAGVMRAEGRAGSSSPQKGNGLPATTPAGDRRRSSGAQKSLCVDSDCKRLHINPNPKARPLAAYRALQSRDGSHFFAWRAGHNNRNLRVRKKISAPGPPRLLKRL